TCRNRGVGVAVGAGDENRVADPDRRVLATRPAFPQNRLFAYQLAGTGLVDERVHLRAGVVDDGQIIGTGGGPEIDGGGAGTPAQLSGVSAGAAVIGLAPKDLGVAGTVEVEFVEGKGGGDRDATAWGRRNTVRHLLAGGKLQAGDAAGQLDHPHHAVAGGE